MSKLLTDNQGNLYLADEYAPISAAEASEMINDLQGDVTTLQNFLAGQSPAPQAQPTDQPATPGDPAPAPVDQPVEAPAAPADGPLPTTTVDPNAPALQPAPSEQVPAPEVAAAPVEQPPLQ